MRSQGKKLTQVARIQARGQLHIPKAGTQNEPQAEFDEALAAFGLQQAGDDGTEPPPDDKCYLWPCNLRTFSLWQRVQTQWRVSMAGPTGLDYASVNAYLRDVARIKPKELPELFGTLQAMESAALAVWAEKTN